MSSSKHFGGWRQRAEAEAKARERSRSPRLKQRASAQACDWVLDWCYGNIRAHTIQRYARNALIDGSTHPTLKRLSRLGNRGAAPKNRHGQLLTWFKNAEGIKIIQPLKNSIQDCWLPPDKLFSFLSRRFPDRFRRNLGAKPATVLRFVGGFVFYGGWPRIQIPQSWATRQISPIFAVHDSACDALRRRASDQDRVCIFLVVSEPTGGGV